MVDETKLVYKFYKNKITQGNLFTYHNFKVEKVLKTTVYRIIKSGLSAENKILKRKGTKIPKVNSPSLLLTLTITPKHPLEKEPKNI